LKNTALDNGLKNGKMQFNTHCTTVPCKWAFPKFSFRQRLHYVFIYFFNFFHTWRKEEDEYFRVLCSDHRCSQGVQRGM